MSGTSIPPRCQAHFLCHQSARHRDTDGTVSCEDHIRDPRGTSTRLERDYEKRILLGRKAALTAEIAMIDKQIEMIG